ncbi:alpha/beta hydrolase [Echinicola pacifica]|uniref:Alpha/beta hydrolase n=1 Tax=Echinicola pacifica TaxID=346377 RepID=A0A918Q3L5_9BACT|nr:alpha/beta fold hydrolase [Echinicola pacifica]GGZ32677.1 alpha/beta hydrolase [Echinicola pacifica]
MPIIYPSSYRRPPRHYFNGHFETVIPSIFRKIGDVKYLRERIATPDGDFLDIDWSTIEHSNKLVIISHGLEGDSQRHYVTAQVKLLNQQGFNVLAWNNRSCSGEMNLTKVLYHHGASHDLAAVVDHVILTKPNYNEIYLTGISMGGAQTLKYLGEQGDKLPTQICAAAVYSTPCNLADSAATLKLPANFFYKRKFLSKLKVKMLAKAKQFPGLIDIELLGKVKDFDVFDDQFTAKLHGFEDGQDFYQSVSADNWMEQIQVPTLIMNAKNDPLLADRCYPVALANQHPHIFLEVPKRGGHTGFVLAGEEFTWAEIRIYHFLRTFG